MKCPICEKGVLKKIITKEIINKVNLGNFPAEKCSSCRETFTSSETMKKIEKIAKEKKVWGLKIKK